MEERKRRKDPRDTMAKSPALYITMLVLWALLATLLWVYFFPKIVRVPFLKGRNISLGVQIVKHLHYLCSRF